MAKYLLTLLAVLIMQLPVCAQVDYSRDIARIFYNNCTACHRQGGAGPFKLETFEDAFAMRFAIKASVTSRHMPPWPPDVTYRTFAHQRTLTETEIQKIAAWVDAGAPQGNPALAPALPVFSTGSQLPRVDKHLTASEYTIATTTDDYRCFALPTELTQDKYISGIEILPGNGRAVHHVMVFYDETGLCKQLDELDPAPGYFGAGGVGNPGAKMISIWIPGSTPFIYPEGLGFRIGRGGTVILQVHYAPNCQGMKDASSINLMFSDKPGTRDVMVAPVLDHYATLTNGPLEIPANTVKKFVSQTVVPIDATILSVFPHMHKIGRSMKVYAIPPGGDTIPLIRVNDWDFHWQDFYKFKKPMRIKTGTTLYAEAVYDNTLNNPHQPRATPELVRRGESTLDEMLLVFFAFVPYMPGDENNIKIDTTVRLHVSVHDRPAPPDQDMFRIYPNPSHGRSIFLSISGVSALQQVSIQDLNGRIIHEHWPASVEFQGDALALELPLLPPGIYVCRAKTDKRAYVARFVMSE